MRRALTIVTFASLAIILPLAGAYLAERPLDPYLRFPGDAEPSPISFEWPAFVVYALVVLAVIAPFAWRIVAARPLAPPPAARQPFPAWGWAGVALTAAGWVLAWTRLPEFAPLQLYTFTPLWLGYILVVNALTRQRTGHCLLMDRPACFIALFPASALFWWYFEYLNRYVGNWHYVGVGAITPLEYVIHASVSFSTVLPAVLSTRDWLASFPRLQTAFADFWPAGFLAARLTASAFLIAGVAGFLLVGVAPQHSYSMVWVAPLLVLTGLQTLLGLPNPAFDLARGDWRNVALPALAALVCGVFWEMWNWRSLAHWEYAIPFVHRFLLFEMPILGYAGYLPFGVVCAMVGELVCDRKARDGRRPG